MTQRIGQTIIAMLSLVGLVGFALMGSILHGYYTGIYSGGHIWVAWIMLVTCFLGFIIYAKEATDAGAT